MPATAMVVYQLADIITDIMDEELQMSQVISRIREIDTNNKSVRMTLEALARELERRAG